MERQQVVKIHAIYFAFIFGFYVADTHKYFLIIQKSQTLMMFETIVINEGYLV